MPDIAKLLKDEVTRLARKEVRTACNPLNSQIRSLKSTIRAQRETISRLQKDLARLATLSPSPSQVLSKDTEAAGNIRISPASIKKHRKRLGLSQGVLGNLLNVSTNTIVRWEAGTSKPRAKHRTGLATLRTMGVREVKKMLEE